jgi:hypothetical protein
MGCQDNVETIYKTKTAGLGPSGTVSIRSPEHGHRILKMPTATLTHLTYDLFQNRYDDSNMARNRTRTHGRHGNCLKYTIIAFPYVQA